MIKKGERYLENKARNTIEFRVFGRYALFSDPALRTLFRNDAASARPEGSMEVVKLVWWEHNCPSGQYSSAKVHRSLRVVQADDPREYPMITVDESAIPGLRFTMIDGE